MKSLFKKVRGNKKGFTLAELLVVVTIVGILVAISIPVFTAQLSKARKATNNANLRAAKAAAIAEYLSDDKTREEDGVEKFEYDVKSGTITGTTVSDDAVKGDDVKIGSDDVAADKLYVTVNVKISGGDDTAEEVTLYPVKEN